MVSDLWNKIHIPQGMWKCLVHFLCPAQLDPGPLSILILTRNCPTVAELDLFWSKIWCWWRLKTRTCSKVGYFASYDSKTVSETRGKCQIWFFDIFFINTVKQGLFWSKINCWLKIWPLKTLNRNISLDLCHKQTPLCTYWAH